MKKKFIKYVYLLIVLSYRLLAQERYPDEKYGNTLNIGVGTGYNGYSMLAVNANYEFDVFKSFTLAPFISAYTFQNQVYWGDPTKPYWDPSYHYYYYHEMVVPVGVKGSYYFDRLLHANPRWDFYAAASIGFTYRSVVWENGYNGDKSVYQSVSLLYLAIHIGSEYHITPKTGLYLDLSSSISTFGVAIHF